MRAAGSTTVAKLGRDAHLTEALDSSSRGAGEPKALHETVRSRLKALVPDRAAVGVESLIAVDNKGRVVARVGDDEGEYGESIAGAEVVGDALRGYLSDDVWGAAGRLRRVAAAPVISKSRERIVGAVVVALETGKRLAEMWKRNLGVDVAIVLGKNVVSSTLPEALLGQLPETHRSSTPPRSQITSAHALSSWTWATSACSWLRRRLSAKPRNSGPTTSCSTRNLPSLIRGSCCRTPPRMTCAGAVSPGCPWPWASWP